MLTELIERKFRRGLFQQVVNHPNLHVFLLKLYLEVDTFAANKLRRFAQLVQEPALRNKIEAHLADEENRPPSPRQSWGWVSSTRCICITWGSLGNGGSRTPASTRRR